MGHWESAEKDGNGAWGINLPADFFLLPSSFFLTSVTQSVAELPSFFYPLHPLQNPLPNFLLASKFVSFH
ncbi:MAG TPA: hypothetical protein DD001_09185 [Microcoleaceae bacterium UBA10368]|jgi:hypothetical protein|nr:hypothetical protein [Microcoleaceae cyanobacterium UBA10368]HCV31621.1 hypothetical protein [Microcoleaceae cyanobacterium UBA9251]